MLRSPRPAPTLQAPHGYGAHPDVNNPASSACCHGNDDKQESFWLAETIKYGNVWAAWDWFFTRLPYIYQPHLCPHPPPPPHTHLIAPPRRYLYLLQDPEHTMSLADYIFTTEAHPLPMRLNSSRLGLREEEGLGIAPGPA